MDPLSQAVVGGLLAQSFVKKIRQMSIGREVFLAGIVGLGAGLLPDIDVFIKSQTDPLLFLEYHRQFTHSIVFMPLGALLATVLFRIFIKKSKLPFKRLYLYCLLGYASHAPLDACTSYGTQLFWPFSDLRVAWSNVAIVDPLFTLPALFLFVLAIRKKRVFFSKFGVAWCVLYLLFGVLQKNRAEQALLEFANSQEHYPVSVEAKPAIFNNVLFRGIYDFEGHYWVHGVRVSWFGKTQIFPGSSVLKPDLDALKVSLVGGVNSVQSQDIDRFNHFSDSWVYVSRVDGGVLTLGDFRYSLLPNSTDYLWAILVDLEASELDHVEYVMDRKLTSEKNKLFWKMVLSN
jgi:inner membrane protein